MRQSPPPSAAQLAPAPPTAASPAGPYWQVATTFTAGYSAGSVAGVQKSPSPLPASTSESPQSGPPELVSLVHALPHIEKSPPHQPM